MLLPCTKNVVCLGVGGEAVFYIARYFHFLGAEVLGFDIRGNSKVRKLKGLSRTRVVLENPAAPFDPATDLIVYTSALPDEVIKCVRNQNPKVKMVEAGEFVNKLTLDFEQGYLGEKEVAAFKKSQIAPLYEIDYSKQAFIGVTGTDGKTTTCSMIYHILRRLGYNPGMITTVGVKVGDESFDTGLHTTTPSAQELFKFIKEMQSKNCTHIVLECTSHGLTMGRLAGIKLDVAVYTNIKREHLDYHKTWGNYAKAKSLLISRHLKKDGVAVLNEGDKRAFNVLRSLADVFVSYKVRDADIGETKSGLEFSLGGRLCKLPVLGRYNVENALAAIEACKILGVDRPASAKALEAFKPVTGRMNILQRKPFYVIVDFAHTPNALRLVLRSVQKLKRAKGSRIILVFGCAGKRDTSKRVPMGRIAKKYANIVILTAEDPRSESLKSINDEIERGWNFVKDGSDKVLIRFDDAALNVGVRRKAVRKALSLAKEGDVVLVTGKGHEQSLCFGTKEYPWNDISEVRKLL